jgi:predicted nucleic acid-binding protein
VFNDHEFNRSIAAWLKTLQTNRDVLASCAITELGVVRILPQSTRGSVTVKDAQEMLMRSKASSFVPFTFLSDDLGIEKLPAWVKQPKHTTDGHLVALAKAHGATLATFDNYIPGALVIPLL